MPARRKIRRTGGYREAHAVILDVEVDLAIPEIDMQFGSCGFGMSDDIAQSFLCNSVQGKLLIPRQSAFAPALPEIDLQTLVIAGFPA